MRYLRYFEANEDQIAKLEKELAAHREEVEKNVSQFFGQHEREYDAVQSPKDLAVVFGKLIKTNGLGGFLKYVKTLISNNKKESQIEKKIADLKGETWVEDPDTKRLNDLFSNPLNVAKLINGKDLGKEIDYKTEDGKEAEGEIKSVKIEDDGTVNVTIDNEKVGEVTKEITELEPAESQSDEEIDAQKKIGAIQQEPGNLKRVANYADFLNKADEKQIKDIGDLIDDEIAKLPKEA